jgi:purine-nucleoside phosphorylase
MLEKIHETVDFLHSKGISHPDIGIVLGTGLGKLVDAMLIEVTVAYKDIPNFCISTVETHHGKLLYGTISGKKVLVMQGRFHFYEGYTMQEITFPVRIMKMLGVQNLLLSNASGGMRADLKKGDLVLIEDHINLLPGNPLMGKNHEALGPRFPDMSRPYSVALKTKVMAASQATQVQVKEGVYVAVAGPNLETRSEYRFLKIIGADMVGMSTVPEVIVANHMNLPCAAISVITDECDPDNLQPVQIEDIIATANAADEKLKLLFTELIKIV